MDAKLEKEFDAFVDAKFIKRVNEITLHWSRYLFTDSKSGNAYCTHCNTISKRSGAGQNKVSKCPNCKKNCYVKMTGYGHGNMFDEAYYVEYKKSKACKGAVIAIGVLAYRDYTYGYKNVETKIHVKARYVFDIHNTHMWKHSNYSNKFEKTSSAYSLAVSWSWMSSHISNLPCYENRPSFSKAAKGTRLEHGADLVNTYTYDGASYIQHIETYCNKPVVEYMDKLGLHGLVQDTFGRQRTNRSINWRAKSLPKMLKLPMQDIREIQKIEKTHPVDFDMLSVIQAAKKGKDINVCINDLVKLHYYFRSRWSGAKELSKILTYTTIKKALNYLDKQETNVSGTWVDYLNDCKTLGYDLNDDEILRPRDLYEAHQKTISLIKYEENEHLNKGIAKQAQKLKNLIFEYDGLLIRPAASSKEIIDEGNALSHCIGGYCKRYAEGKDILLFLRRRNEPDKSLCTVELQAKTYEVIQYHGYKNKFNSKAEKERIDKFIKAYEREVIHMLNNQNKKECKAS